MKISYHGHACFTVEEGGHALIIDPFLSGNGKADLAPGDVKVEAILLSHGHGDHVGDTEEIARANHATIIAPFELAMYFGRKGFNVHPMHLGGGHAFDFGHVKLTLAFHGSGIELDDHIEYAGNPCGFLITMGGKTFYHAGDTGLFGDMKIIGDRNHIDVAALPIGDNFTMGPDDALLAAEWIGAKKVIPMHYNTFDLIAQDGQAFATALSDKGLEGVVLQPGGTLEV
ncbi:metal-dependent hydrolase [Alicyclobacillus sp. ALC3]|uniref:metal-dependent hydrolase n=1 Tax=Alicyclobacillus sp. ALC3 TaxID=2796143 RepID=UPI00237972B8|nr:metal-dependent hydrolase [Alicyclobacillus sp. ALC3]WDL95588.1 metal-dependent hydrolase [Alicyclobacillus sp. ALC3]